MKLNSTLYRVLLIASFLMLNACIIMGISAIFSYLNTGADRASILHLQKELAPSYLPKVTWSPLQNEGRPMEKQTLKEIERDYLKAWYTKTLALQQNNILGIADYYTDSARTKLYDIITFNKKHNTYLKSTSLSHQPNLNFYSADGKIVVLTDSNVEIYEEVYQNNIRISKRTEIASYQIMLLLEDGFWRIRHMVKVTSKSKIKAPSTNIETKGLEHSKGINYYPQKAPWNMYGNGFKESTIDTDFQKIKELGLNSVRIFVPYKTFGKAKVDSILLKQLKITLNFAQKRNLKVIVTLFDFYGDYSINQWTITHRHAEIIVNSLKKHPALLAWDIKNEPDLDFESRGKEKVISWLEQMCGQIKSWDKHTPVTIGWSSAKNAYNLSNMVDFVSFHFYKKSEDFITIYRQLQTKVPDKTIVLQEYGYSSYSGFWNAFLGSETKQANYYKTMQGILDKEKIPFLLWTLYDFEDVPNTVVGKLPWRKVYQEHYGLFNIEKKPKKSLNIFTEK